MSLNIAKRFYKEKFLEIADYQDSDAMRINRFSSQHSSASVTVPIEFSMEEFEFVVAEQYKFEY